MYSPNKTRDGTEILQSEYGFTGNNAPSFNFLKQDSDRAENDALRSYEPSTYKNEAKRKLLTRERESLRIRSRRGLRSIFQHAASELGKSVSKSKSPRSFQNAPESRSQRSRESSNFKITKTRAYQDQGSIVTLENTSPSIEDEGSSYNFLTKNTLKTNISIQDDFQQNSTEEPKTVKQVTARQVFFSNQNRKVTSPKTLIDRPVTTQADPTNKFKIAISSITKSDKTLLYPTNILQGGNFVRNLSVRACSPSHILFKESLKSFLDLKYNSPKNESAYGLNLESKIQQSQQDLNSIPKKKPKLISLKARDKN